MEALSVKNVRIEHMEGYYIGESLEKIWTVWESNTIHLESGRVPDTKDILKTISITDMVRTINIFFF